MFLLNPHKINDITLRLSCQKIHHEYLIYMAQQRGSGKVTCHGLVWMQLSVLRSSSHAHGLGSSAAA